MSARETEVLNYITKGFSYDDIVRLLQVSRPTVLTYVRRSWGNAAAPITPTDVAEIRGATQGRAKPWTEAELRGVSR